MRYTLLTWMLMSLAAVPAAATTTGAQNPVDRSDPSVVEQELKDPREVLRKEDGAATPLLDRDGAGQSALTRPVRIDTLRISGSVAIPSSAYLAAAAPFLGRDLAARDLRALASTIARVARRAGYGLATAWVPEQTIEGGELVLVVDEGRVDEISASGAATASVEALLAPLATGNPIPTRWLEKRLLLAGDLPGVTVGKARLERRNGRNLLVVRTWLDRTEGGVVLDNWGSDTVGPVRAQVALALNRLLGIGDRLTLSAVGTPLQPDEFGLVRAAYDTVVDSEGTVISVSGYAARSEPGGILSDRDFEGRSLEATVGVSHPVLRRRALSLWTDVEFNLRDAEQTREDILVRDDRLAMLRASSFVVARVGEARLRARLTFTRGLGIFDATHAGDPLASRDEGSAVFSKMDLWTRLDVPLGGPFSLQLTGEAQAASRALLSSEEMGLGGRYFLRGYDYREFSGDKGIAGSAELRFDLPRPATPLRGAQLYAYADAGSVGNYDGGSGGGSLVSAGGGVRIRLGPSHEAAFEVGVPLKDGAFGESHDPRLSFVIGSRF
jgi:hemolysin activation/secretion protein